MKCHKNSETQIFGFHLNNLISNRNVNQIREVCEAFKQIAGLEVAEAICKLVGRKDAIPYNAFSKLVIAWPSLFSFLAGYLTYSFFLSPQSRPVTMWTASSRGASTTALTGSEQTTPVS